MDRQQFRIRPSDCGYHPGYQEAPNDLEGGQLQFRVLSLQIHLP